MRSARMFSILFCIYMCIFAVSTSFATAPERLNYQGTLTDNNSNRITGTVSMIFNIYDQQSGGNLIWGPETIATVQVIDGLFSVVLGETVPISSSLFSSGSRYISVTVNSEPMSPRQLINSVPYALNGIPSGVIAMWSGSINNIPTGWALCDGSNGTPNLRDRFIVGAGSGYGVGSTGGEATHVLTVAEMPSHSHGVTDPGHIHAYKNGSSTTSAGYAANTNNGSPTQYTENATTGISINNAGSGAAHNNLPPYYALAFIMKL